MLHHEFFYQHVKHLQAEQRERVRLEHLAYEAQVSRPTSAERFSYRSRLLLSRLLIGLGRRVMPTEAVSH